MALSNTATETVYNLKSADDRFGMLKSEEATKIMKIGAAIGIAKSSWETYQMGRDQLRAALAYTLALKSEDHVYMPVQKWLLANMKAKNKKALKVKTNRSGVFRGDDDDAMEEPPGYGGRPSARPAIYSQLEYDGSREQKVMIGGHKISVRIVTEDLAKPAEPFSEFKFMKPETRIVFTSYSKLGIQAVHDWIEEVAAEYYRSERNPTFFINSGYGHWRTRAYPKRPLSSVVLADGQKEMLISDLERFWASEDRYNALGLPYHRGYLLSGPPGTGKTSIVKAIASHFKKDLFFMSMSSLGGDSPNASFLRLTGDMEGHGILLLEDIDTVKGTHKRASEDAVADGASVPNASSDTTTKEDVSLETLLNFLDGVATPHGLVTFLTTNRKNAIDDALLRPGRADVIVDVHRAEAAQVERIYEMAFEAQFPWELPTTNELTGKPLSIAPSVVTEAIKQAINDPEDAAKIIFKVWEEKAE